MKEELKTGKKSSASVEERIVRLLKKNGLMVFELGENQFDTVKNMLLENGFSDINYALDIQKIKRGISGIKYS